MVTGGTSEAPELAEPAYAGEKLSAVDYFATVRTADGSLVCKAQTQPGMFNQNPTLAVSAGTDIVAIVASASYLCGGGSPAGALAGAGVV